MAPPSKNRNPFRHFLSKNIPKKTESESIGADTTSSKDSDVLRTTTTGSDVKPSEPQAEGPRDSIPTEVQASQTLATAIIETINDSIELEAATAETRGNEGELAPSIALEAELAKSPEQVASNLWDEAYDTLKVEDPDRLDQYERILTLWLQDGPPNLTPRRPSMSEPFNNDIVPSDQLKRREQMNKIIGSWLSNTGEDETSEDETSEDETSGDEDSDTNTKRFNIVYPLQHIMRSAAQNTPDTALLWAGACLSVQSLSDPTFRSEATILGIGHIISRMAWYSLLPKLLDTDDSYKAFSGEDFTEEQQILRKGIIVLYKAILSYQIGVVCSQSNYLCRRTNRALPSTSGNLSEADIVGAEKALACFHGQHIEAYIHQIVESLNDETLDVIRDEEQTTKKAKALLKDLNAINTQQSISVLISDKSQSLKPLYEWVCSTPEYAKFYMGDTRVLWVSGAPGTGTTMLMLAIIQGLSQQRSSDPDSKILSYSFCGNGKHRPDNAASVVKSLIFLVLEHQPELVDHLANKCESTGRNHFSDANDFYALSLVLYGMIQDDLFKSTIFVVDGIDECGIEGLDSFLSLITTTTRISSRVKWLASISSNKSGFVSTRLGIEIQPHLNLDSGYEEVRDVFEKYYIPSKVDELAKYGRYEGTFRDKVTTKLLQLSSWNFLWADVACEAIIRDDPWHALDNLDIPASIKPIYVHMKSKIESLSPVDQRYCFRVLLAMAIAFRPLDITELEAIVDLPPEVDLKILVEKKCFAFLELCDRKVYFTHHSARDFVQQDMKIHISHAHSRVVQRCLRFLSKPWEKSTTDSRSKKSEDSVTSTNYAAVYWIRHLYDAEGIEKDAVIQFLTDHSLKWLDLLALKGRLSQAWELMRELETLLKVELKTRPSDDNSSHAQDFLRLIRETHRLLHFHQFTKSPIGVGAKNSLLFCPSNSMTRQRLLPSEIPELSAPPVIEQNWSRVVHVLRGHSDYVRCCAYSHDGRFLASASDDGSIRIWDTTTGKSQHSFRDFDGWVYLVAFSSKGLLAASDSNTIKIWDVATGMQQELPNDRDLYADNTDCITDISFSDDGSMLVAVGNEIITIWKLPSYSVIVRQVSFSVEDIKHARFSSDRTLLGTVSADCVTIWKLDNNTENESWNQAEDQIEDQAVIEVMNEAAMEPDTVVKKNQELWELRKLRDFQLQLENGDGLAYGVAFSPDSKYVATGTASLISGNNTVHIWELGSDKPPSILAGHTDDVNKVSFSPDGSLLASVSDDKTIRIWKAPWDDEAKQPILILRGHSRPVYALSFSPWQRHLATCSSDETIRIWDYDSYDEAETEPETRIKPDDEVDRKAQPHTRAICFIASSNDGNFIASASEDGLICLWDGNSGDVLHNLWGHEGYIRSLVFSSDSQRLVSASNDGTVRIWDTTGKDEPCIIYGHNDWVRSAVLSRDGKLVASGSDDRTVRVWDITRPSAWMENWEVDEAEKNEDTDCMKVLRGHTDFVISVTFSDDRKYVAAGGDDGNVLLWELSMDQPSTLHKPKAMNDSGRRTVYAVIFVSNASKLIASSYEKIRIWNTETCELIQRVKMDRTFYTLQVNPLFSRYLITEFGPIPMEDLELPSEHLSAQTKPTAWCPYSVVSCSSESWITWKEKKVIFLPEQYRPASEAASVWVQGHNVVIGCDSGRVLFFRFKEVVDFGDLV